MIVLQFGLVFSKVILADNGFGEYVPVNNLDSLFHSTEQYETVEQKKQPIPELI